MTHKSQNLNIRPLDKRCHFWAFQGDEKIEYFRNVTEFEKEQAEDGQ